MNSARWKNFLGGPVSAELALAAEGMQDAAACPATAESELGDTIQCELWEGHPGQHEGKWSSQ